MVGYILIGIGAWLVLDDWKIARAKKLEGGQDGIHETGNDSGGSNRAGKSSAVHQKPDRNRRVTPIGVPVTKTKGGKNDVSEKSVHKIKPDQNRNSPGDHSTGQPDTTPIGDQGKGVKDKSKEGGSRIIPGSKRRDARNKNDHEDDVSDNGDDVGAESSSRDESNGTEIDQGDGSSAGD